MLFQPEVNLLNCIRNFLSFDLAKTVLQVKVRPCIEDQKVRTHGERHPSSWCLCRQLKVGMTCVGQAAPVWPTCWLHAPYIPASRRGAVALRSLRVWLYRPCWATGTDDRPKCGGSWSTASVYDAACQEFRFVTQKWSEGNKLTLQSFRKASLKTYWEFMWGGVQAMLIHLGWHSGCDRGTH